MPDPTPPTPPSAQAEALVARRFARCDLDHPLVAHLYRLALAGCGEQPEAVEPPLAPETAASKAGSARLAPPRQALLKINPPPLPQVFVEVQRRINDPRTTARELADVISLDSGLASLLLRVVNSPYYGLSAPVDTLSRAVTVVGMREIATLAVGCTVSSLFTAPPPASLLDLRRHWRHSLAVALTCRNLARLAGRRDGERHFVAGLLHDVGRLLLAIAEPDMAAEARQRAFQRGETSYEAERAVFGCDHAELAASVIHRWQLPESLALAVGRHHNPGNDNDLADHGQDLVHLADMVAVALGHGATAETLVPPLVPAALARSGLTPEQVAEAASHLDQRLEELVQAFLPKTPEAQAKRPPLLR